MKAAQLLYEKGLFTENDKNDLLTGAGTQLVLAFGAKEVFEKAPVFNEIQLKFPQAHIVSCTTSGEIYKEAVYDDTVTITALEFEKTNFKVQQININNLPGSYEAGQQLFKDVDAEDLSYVLILSDGSLVNGSELVRGIDSVNSKHIPVTGGLAGDADKFEYTLSGYNQPPQKGNIVFIGFYGPSLKVAHGSLGGWDMFGPERKVTKSKSNKLYEIDDTNALELYKKYLGKYAEELPGSALLFPLSVRDSNGSDYIVRTILSIDNNEQCMIFAGDVPEGSYVRFMKANFDKLVDAAAFAATSALQQLSDQKNKKPKLALLISCVGRKLILGNRIDEEIVAVRSALGDNTMLTGFYSYGEISPVSATAKCELHNQTMTITTLDEA
jgi:hypothetical protein